MIDAMLWSMTCAVTLLAQPGGDMPGAAKTPTPIPLADLSFFPEEQTTPALPLPQPAHVKTASEIGPTLTVREKVVQPIELPSETKIVPKTPATVRRGQWLKPSKPVAIASPLPLANVPSQTPMISHPSQGTLNTALQPASQRSLPTESASFSPIGLAKLSFFPDEPERSESQIATRSVSEIPPKVATVVASAALLPSKASPEFKQPVATSRVSVATNGVISGKSTSVELAKAANSDVRDRLIHAVAAFERGPSAPSHGTAMLEVGSLPTDDRGRRQLARQLLASGRSDLARGDLEAARQNAYRAMELAIEYGRREDSPSVLLIDIGKVAMHKAP